MSVDLDNIESQCGQSVAPGMADHLYIECQTDTDLIPAATDQVVTGDITFTGTNGFYKWDTSRVLSKNTFLVEQTGDKDNSAYKTTYSVFVPGVSPAKQKILSGTKGCGHILLVPDLEGKLRILGSLEKGADVSYTETINDTVKGYNVVVECDSTHPPYYYEGVITAAT